MQKDSDIFEQIPEKWDKLCNYLDENEFTISDMLAVICAHLVKDKHKNFGTTLIAGGQKFFIQIKKF